LTGFNTVFTTLDHAKFIVPSYLASFE